MQVKISIISPDAYTGAHLDARCLARGWLRSLYLRLQPRILCEKHNQSELKEHHRLMFYVQKIQYRQKLLL